ncbi:MAG: hypothetical protein KDA81_06845 [Planctomycetaceae bacterium]|nr:hypothetical protein [Planctomycetaceae bacterium]
MSVFEVNGIIRKTNVEVMFDSPQTPDPTGNSSVLDGWSVAQLDGHRVEVFDSCSTNADALGCVLFLHGHGRIMLSQNAIYTELLRQHRLIAVCPDGQRSWWLDRICPEFDASVSPQQWLLESLLPAVEKHWSLASPKIALLGVSMGGQGVLQLSYRYARQFPVVAAISPAVDFHQMYGQGLPLDDIFADQEEARQATVVLNLHPLAWPKHQFFCCDPLDAEWFDGCARLGMKLSSSGILHDRDLETSVDGHTWNYFNHVAPRVIDHIVAGLKAC